MLLHPLTVNRLIEDAKILEYLYAFEKVKTVQKGRFEFPPSERHEIAFCKGDDKVRLLPVAGLEISREDGELYIYVIAPEDERLLLTHSDILPGQLLAIAEKIPMVHIDIKADAHLWKTFGGTWDVDGRDAKLEINPANETISCMSASDKICSGLDAWMVLKQMQEDLDRCKGTPVRDIVSRWAVHYGFDLPF